MKYKEHYDKWKDCTKCPLCSQRSKIVLARGTIPCDVCFIGEAPGESEDTLGQPFVGPAGKILDSIIYEAGLMDSLDTPYAMTNLVACFPADAKRDGINEPERSEIKACEERLREFITLCKPKLLVLVGSLAQQYVLAMNLRIRTAGIVHPAAILRAKIAQQSMMRRKAVITLANALERLQSEPNYVEPDYKEPF